MLYYGVCLFYVVDDTCYLLVSVGTIPRTYVHPFFFMSEQQLFYRSSYSHSSEACCRRVAEKNCIRLASFIRLFYVVN